MQAFYNVVSDVSDVAVVMGLLVLLPMMALRRRRNFAGLGLILTATVVIFQLWLTALLILWNYLKLTAVIVGVLTTPVGALLFALAEALWHHAWAEILNLMTSVLIIVVFYFAGKWAIENVASSSHAENRG